MPESNTQSNNSLPDFAGQIEIHQHAGFTVNETAVCQVVGRILCDAEYRNGSISIAVVDDSTIHELNVRYLEHDYPTDVLSFVLDSDRNRNWIEGEVVVSGDTARAVASEYGWDPHSELMLYIIHGSLHLIGMDDSSEVLRSQMQEAETRYLGLAGLKRPGESTHETGLS